MNRVNCVKKKIDFKFIMLISAVFVSLVAVIAFFCTFKPENQRITPIFSNSSSSFESGWMNQYGLSYDVSTLSSLSLDFDCEKAFNLSKAVPQFSGEAAVFFRTNNLVVNVYLDEELIYFTNENGYYNNLSSFSSYCYLVFSEADIGKTIRLEMFKTPVSTGCRIDNFKFGRPDNLLNSVHSADSSIIVASFIVIVAALIYIIMGVITRKTYEHHRGLIFLGLFSFSCWFLTDTLWVYNTICDIYVIEISAKIFLTAAVPCFMMYVYDFFNIYHKKLYSILIIIGFFFFALFFVLDLTGVLSYSYTINFIHAYILTSGITTLVEMISYLSKINGNKGESRIFNLGVTFFVFFSLFDIGRFYQGNEGDSSLMTRFGMFILIVTSIAVISTDIIAMLKLAVEAGKIGKIAYTDANTGLGNPAAFKEKFEFLDRTKNNYNYIGIIQFDVNNLKIINDTLGHEAGDLLIKTAAEMIDNSFGTIGNCYRVGGDEFVAITTYNHAPLVCEEAIVKFESAISQFNNNPDKPFELRVAYGIAYYQNSSQQFQSLKEVHKLADERMYNHKCELKARFAKTAAEAVIR